MRLVMKQRALGVFAVSVWLMVGGGVVRAQGTGAAPPKPDTSAASVVRAYIDAYNSHDIEKVLSFLAADFVWLSITADSVSVEARGVAAIRTQLAQYFRTIPTSRSELEEVSALGPWVSARERAHWVGANGPRSQASLSVYEVRGGRLQRVWYYPAVRESR